MSILSIDNIKDNGWKEILKDEFEKEYFKKLESFVDSETKTNKVYPKIENIFSAFNHTSLENIKVIILGQDPYHGENQANGLSFSVNHGITQPPSLQNIFKELNADIGIKPPTHGNLESWANQGVLLLNATLTVRANTPGSHQNQGWETFTDNVIKLISKKKEGLIFILWGRYAQAKEALIDKSKHFIIKSPHPSPFSAYNGFFGSKPFSKTNEILRKLNKKEIDWTIQ